jgi:hypothetical protein
LLDCVQSLQHVPAAALGASDGVMPFTPANLCELLLLELLLLEEMHPHAFGYPHHTGIDIMPLLTAMAKCMLPL